MPYQFMTDFELQRLYNRVYRDITKYGGDEYGLDMHTLKLAYPEHAPVINGILEEQNKRINPVYKCKLCKDTGFFVEGFLCSCHPDNKWSK